MGIQTAGLLTRTTGIPAFSLPEQLLWDQKSEAAIWLSALPYAGKGALIGLGLHLAFQVGRMIKEGKPEVHYGALVLHTMMGAIIGEMMGILEVTRV